MCSVLKFFSKLYGTFSRGLSLPNFLYEIFNLDALILGWLLALSHLVEIENESEKDEPEFIQIG